MGRLSYKIEQYEEAKKDLKENARPELVRMPDSIDKYDTIILAYPAFGFHIMKNMIEREKQI